MAVTIKEMLKEAAVRLAYCAERPRLEAEILMSHCLDRDRVWLMTHDNDEMESPDRYMEMIQRRVQHEPVEYITGKVGFYGKEFGVTEGVLIPRPETEILVEKAASLIESRAFSRVAEIGTGSGVISIVLADIFPHLEIEASDISRKAIECAEKNAERHGVANRIRFHETHLLDGIVEDIDMIVSNPPYIAAGTLLSPNVALYEPEEALFAAGDGTEILKAVIDTAMRRDVAAVACEMGYDQKEAMEIYFESVGIGEYEFYKDLSGLYRGFVIEELP